jgi:hypothetical protein
MKLFLHRVLYILKSRFHDGHSLTVRVAFPVIFMSATLLGAALILPTDASYVRLTSSTGTVKTGETFYINVYAGAHIPVNAINIELKFPTNKIKIKNIDIGESVITLWTKEPYVENGRVILTGGTFRKGFLGEHLIATINAEALTDGEARFLADDVFMYAGDGSGREVSVGETGEESILIAVANDFGIINAAASIRIYTDINGDGKVGMDDILLFMKAWASQSTIFDFNRDNKMTFTDFAIILSDSFYK